MQRTYTINLEAPAAAGLLAALNAIGSSLESMHGHAQGAQASVQGLGQGMGQATPSVQGLIAAFGGMAAARMAVEEMREVIKAVGDELKANRDYAEKTAEANIKLRDVLRELKFIRGETPGGDHVPEDVLLFARDTGMKTDDAAKYVKAETDAYNALPPEQRASKEVRDAVNLEAGRLVARADMDPTQTGKIVGMLGRYGKADSAEEASNTLALVAKNLGVKSMADFKKLAPAYFDVLSELTGEGNRIGDPETAAALFATGTTKFSTSARAKTGLLQANRLLRHLGDDSEASRALAEMGVTPGMDFMQAAEKVRQHVPEGQGDLWLKSKGFHNSTEISAFLKYAEVLPDVQRTVAEDKQFTDPGSPKFMQAGRELSKGSLDWMKGDPVALKRVADTDRQIQEFVKGRPGELINILREASETELVHEGAIPGDGNRNLGQKLWDNTIGLGAGEGRRQQDIDVRGFERLHEAGRKVGLDYGNEKDFVDQAINLRPDERGAYATEILTQIANRPGGAEAAAGALGNEKIVAVLERIAQNTEANKDRPFANLAPAPGPMPARPVRAGGAN